MLDSGIQAAPVPGVAAAGVRVRWTVSLLLLLAVMTAFFDRIDIAVLFTNRAIQERHRRQRSRAARPA